MLVGSLHLMWLMLAVGLAVGLTVAQYTPEEVPTMTGIEDQPEPVVGYPPRRAGWAKVALVVALVWWLKRRKSP